MKLRLLSALFLAGLGVAPVAAADPNDKTEAGSVVFEVRILTVPDGSALPGPRTEKGGVAFLSGEQFVALLEKVQADRQANIMQAPKVTAFEKQTATVRIGERQEFVTGLEASRVNGTVVFTPIQTAVELGETLTLCGRASADRRRVSVSVKYTSTHLANNLVSTIPVTVPAQPAGDGAPFPITQILQVPDVRTFTIAKGDLVVPEGGHAVITGPVTEVEQRVVVRTPVLSELPYLGRLFTSVGYGKQKVRTFMVVSARLLPAEFEVAPMPRPVEQADR
jgi:hypothetical protein